MSMVEFTYPKSFKPYLKEGIEPSEIRLDYFFKTNFFQFENDKWNIVTYKVKMYEYKLYLHKDFTPITSRSFSVSDTITRGMLSYSDLTKLEETVAYKLQELHISDLWILVDPFDPLGSDETKHIFSYYPEYRDFTSESFSIQRYPENKSISFQVTTKNLFKLRFNRFSVILNNERVFVD